MLTSEKNGFFPLIRFEFYVILFDSAFFLDPAVKFTVSQKMHAKDPLSGTQIYAGLKLDLFAALC